MLISENRSLKEARNELARKIHKKRGGDYLDAVGEANAVTRRAYQAARRGNAGPRAAAEAAARAIREALKVKPTLVLGAKPGSKKRRERAAVKQAVTRAVAEVAAKVASGALAPTPARGAAAPDSRPLHELSNEEFEQLFAEAVIGARVTEGARAPGVTETAPEPVDLPDTPLHQLDADSFMDLAAGAGVAYGSAAGHRSPFWAGASAQRSPFWAGVDD